MNPCTNHTTSAPTSVALDNLPFARIPPQWRPPPNQSPGPPDRVVDNQLREPRREGVPRLGAPSESPEPPPGRVVDDGLREPRSEMNRWQSVLDELKLCIPKPSFDTWLQGTHAGPVEGGILRVSTPNAFVSEMLERRMSLVISQAVEKVYGEHLTVVFTPSIVPAHPEPKTEPPLRLDELDHEGLITWLVEWGHHRPESLVATYGREEVVKQLSRLVGVTPRDADVDRFGPGLLNSNLKQARRYEVIDLPTYAQARARPGSGNRGEN